MLRYEPIQSRRERLIFSFNQEYRNLDRTLDVKTRIKIKKFKMYFDDKPSKEMTINVDDMEFLIGKIHTFPKLPMDTWMKVFYLSLFHGVADMNKTAEDQIKRGRHIALYYTKTKVPVTQIIMMDGHGRMTASLMKAFWENKMLDELKDKIHLVDMNIFANKWHTVFMPEGVSSATKDQIVNIWQVLDHAVRDGQQSKVVYMNFCSLGSSFKRNQIEEKLTAANDALIPVMIGFCTRNSVINCQQMAKLGFDEIAERRSYKTFSNFSLILKRQRSLQ